MESSATYSWLHTLDPFAIQFNQSFGIRWYGLAYLAGFYFGYLFIKYLARRNLTTLPISKIADFVTTVAFGTIIGGRLGYCVFYNPSLFTDFRSSLPFWGVLAVNEGGMASHGGIIGILVACYFFAKKYNHNPIHLAELTAVGGTIGIFFGRVANFINGELYGRIVEGHTFFAVRFPQEIATWQSEAPERLGLLAPLFEQVRKTALGFDSFHSATNKAIEMAQQGDLLIQAKLIEMLPLRYPSQLLEAALEGLVPFTILTVLWLRKVRPGVILSTFFIVYPICRFFGEDYRMPDIGIGYGLFGLTRGQWLSIAMIVVGIVSIPLGKRLQRSDTK